MFIMKNVIRKIVAGSFLKKIQLDKLILRMEVSHTSSFVWYTLGEILSSTNFFKSKHKKKDLLLINKLTNCISSLNRFVGDQFPQKSRFS